MSIIVYFYNILPNEFVKLEESLINQTFGFENIEIILVDDCSIIDESKSLILDFDNNHNNVHAIFLNEHFGEIYAFNVGLGNAKTDYVIFFNSIDLLNLNSCALLYKEIYENDVDIVIGNYTSSNQENNFTKYFKNSCFLSTNKLDYNLFKIELVLGSRIYKRRFVSRVIQYFKIQSVPQFNFFTLINANNIILINEDILSLKHPIKKLNEYNLDKLIVLNKLLKKDYNNIKIAIKTPNPSNGRHWGDFFFSLALKKAFEKKGFGVTIHEREFWDSDEDVDIVIVLRGLFEYTPQQKHINLMWNISHPDIVSYEEYEKFDFVFIASEKFANKINNEINTSVTQLLQCTDPEVFYPLKNEMFEEDILFVGVTRGVFREIVQDISKTNNDFSVFGYGWKEFLDDNFIKGDFIPNEILNQAYSSCRILLNDHWEDMKENDFPSNRLFDALACDTFVISDGIESVNTIFEGNIITYFDLDDLDAKLKYYSSHDVERKLLSNNGMNIVLSNHTFDKRVDEILDALINLDFNNFI